MYLYSPVWWCPSRDVAVFRFVTKLTVRLCSETGSSQNPLVFASTDIFYKLRPLQKKQKPLPHTMTTLPSPSFTVGMLWDEWWAVPGFPHTQSSSISVEAELRFGFIRPYNLLPHDFSFFQAPLWCCPHMHFLKSGFFLASLPFSPV